MVDREDKEKKRFLEVVMQEQDKRAVEFMCRCGLDIGGVIAVFPKFSQEDIVRIYESVKGVDKSTGSRRSQLN